MSKNEIPAVAVVVIAIVLLGFLVVVLACGGMVAFWYLSVDMARTPAELPMASVTARGDTLSVVREITAAQLGVHVSEIQPSTSLAELGADELDMVELVMELEDHFDVSIPDAAIENVTGSQTWSDGADKLTMEKLAEIVSSAASLGATNSIEVSPPDYDSPEVQAELEKLTGKWNTVTFHIDGVPADVSDWQRYSFAGDRMTIETSATGANEVKFYLNPHTNPKQLDTGIMADGVEEISKGIYAVDGDTALLCWRVIGERPTDFQSTPGDDKIVLVLRRAND